MPLQAFCGPHALSDSHHALCAEVLQWLSIPLADPLRITDEDLVFRFLIAHRWDVGAATQTLQEYLQWRKMENIDRLVADGLGNNSGEGENTQHKLEEFPNDISEFYPCGFHGKDKFGNPLYYERPNQTGIRELLKRYDIGFLQRWHVFSMESTRNLYRSMGRDRVSVVLDLEGIGMSILMDLKIINFLKDNAKIDQKMFPEHLRFLFIINAPSSFSFLWRILAPLLDERVRQKIHIFDKKFLAPIQEYIELDQLPAIFGGTGGALISLASSNETIFANSRKPSERRISVVSGNPLPTSPPSALASVTAPEQSVLAPVPPPLSLAPSSAASSLFLASLLQQSLVEGMVLGLNRNNSTSVEWNSLQWFRDEEPIEVTDPYQFLVTCEDVGHRLRLEVVATSSSVVYWQSEGLVMAADPVAQNAHLSNVTVGSEAALSYDYWGGEEGLSEAFWSRSWDGSIWEPFPPNTGMSPNGGQGCGLDADDLGFQIKCVVTPVRSDGKTGASVELVQSCGLSEMDRNALVEYACAGTATFPVLVEGYIEGHLTLTTKEVRISVGLGDSKREYHSAHWQASSCIAITRPTAPSSSLDISSTSISSTTLLNRSNSLCGGSNNEGVSSSGDGGSIDPTAFSIALTPTRTVMLRASDRGLRARIMLTFRLFYALTTASISERWLGKEVAGKWRRGEFRTSSGQQHRRTVSGPQALGGSPPPRNSFTEAVGPSSGSFGCCRSRSSSTSYNNTLKPADNFASVLQKTQSATTASSSVSSLLTTEPWLPPPPLPHAQNQTVVNNSNSLACSHQQLASDERKYGRHWTLSRTVLFAILHPDAFAPSLISASAPVTQTASQSQPQHQLVGLPVMKF